MLVRFRLDGQLSFGREMTHSGSPRAGSWRLIPLDEDALSQAASRPTTSERIPRPCDLSHDAAIQLPFTSTRRAIKDSPSHLHDGRLLTLDNTIGFFSFVFGLQLSAGEEGANRVHASALAPYMKGREGMRLIRMAQSHGRLVLLKTKGETDGLAHSESTGGDCTPSIMFVTRGAQYCSYWLRKIMNDPEGCSLPVASRMLRLALANRCQALIPPLNPSPANHGRRLQPRLVRRKL